MEAEDVSIGIVEPCGLLRAQHADMIDGPQAWEIIIVEDNTTPLKLMDLRNNITHLEADRRVIGLRRGLPLE